MGVENKGPQWRVLFIYSPLGTSPRKIRWVRFCCFILSRGLHQHIPKSFFHCELNPEFQSGFFDGSTCSSFPQGSSLLSYLFPLHRPFQKHLSPLKFTKCYLPRYLSKWTPPSPTTFTFVLTLCLLKYTVRLTLKKNICCSFVNAIREMVWKTDWTSLHFYSSETL